MLLLTCVTIVVLCIESVDMHRCNLANDDKYYNDELVSAGFILEEEGMALALAFPIGEPTGVWGTIIRLSLFCVTLYYP